LVARPHAVEIIAWGDPAAPHTALGPVENQTEVDAGISSGDAYDAIQV
jgi:hypothetical protein